MGMCKYFNQISWCAHVLGDKMCCFANKEHELKCQYKSILLKSHISGLDFKSSHQEHFVVMIIVWTTPAAGFIQHSTPLSLYRNGFFLFKKNEHILKKNTFNANVQLRFLSARLRPFFFQLTGTELEAGGLLLDKKPGQLPGAKLLVTSVHSGDKWQILWWQWTRECSYTFWFPPKGVPCATLGRVSYYFCFPSEKNTFCWEIKYLGYRISLVSWRGGCFEDPFACSPRTV